MAPDCLTPPATPSPRKSRVSHKKHGTTSSDYVGTRRRQYTSTRNGKWISTDSGCHAARSGKVKCRSIIPEEDNDSFHDKFDSPSADVSEQEPDSDESNNPLSSRSLSASPTARRGKREELRQAGRLEDPPETRHNYQNFPSKSLTKIILTKITTSKLRELFQLQTGRCGSPRVNRPNVPCRQPFAEGENPTIDEHLDCLRTLRWPSDVTIELTKVAKLVTCTHHERNIDSRVENWMAQLATYMPPLEIEGKVSHALATAEEPATNTRSSSNPRALEQSGRSRLSEKARNGSRIVETHGLDSDKTSASRYSYEDFGDSTALDRAKTIDTMCQLVSDYYDYGKDEDMKKIKVMLRVLKRDRRRTEHDRSLKEASVLADSDAKPRFEHRPEPYGRKDASQRNNGEKRKPMTKRDPGSEMQRSQSPQARNFGTATGGSTSRTDESNEDPFKEIESRRAKKDPLSDIEDKLRTSQTPWKNNKKMSGWVYAYQITGYEQYVKIGHTTKSIESRLQYWHSNCGYDIKNVGLPAPIEVPLARLTEALCFAELNDCRKHVPCQRCQKVHVEWFDIKAEKARQVIRKWSLWMATDPFELVEDQFVLKPTERRKLNRGIAKFVEDVTFRGRLKRG